MCSGHLRSSSGVYEQQNASTFITRLRVAMNPLLIVLSMQKALHRITVFKYIEIFAWITKSSPYLPEDGDRIQSPKRCVLNKSRTMDNVQKQNNCLNVLSSQTFRSDNCLCLKFAQNRMKVFVRYPPPVFTCIGMYWQTLLSLPRISRLAVLELHLV
jgi:hypothetical protein